MSSKPGKHKNKKRDAARVSGRVSGSHVVYERMEMPLSREVGELTRRVRKFEIELSRLWSWLFALRVLVVKPADKRRFQQRIIFMTKQLRSARYQLVEAKAAVKDCEAGSPEATAIIQQELHRSLLQAKHGCRSKRGKYKSNTVVAEMREESRKRSRTYVARMSKLLLQLPDEPAPVDPRYGEDDARMVLVVARQELESELELLGDEIDMEADIKKQNGMLVQAKTLVADLLALGAEEPYLLRRKLIFAEPDVKYRPPGRPKGGQLTNVD